MISTKTVESHVSSVLRKLQLSTRHELTKWATDRRLSDPRRRAVAVGARGTALTSGNDRRIAAGHPPAEGAVGRPADPGARHLPWWDRRADEHLHDPGRQPELFRRWLGFGGELLDGRLPDGCASGDPAHRRPLRRPLRVAQHIALGRREGITDTEIASLGGELVTPVGRRSSWRRCSRRRDGRRWRHRRRDVGGAGRALDEAELVELTMLIAHYLMLATVLRSLRVQLERPPSGAPPRSQVALLGEVRPALTRLRNGQPVLSASSGGRKRPSPEGQPTLPVVRRPSSRPSEGVRGLARPGVEHRSVRDATSKSTLCRSAEGVCR